MVMPTRSAMRWPISGQPRARQQHRDVHLGALDDHLRRQPAGGVEDLVAALDAVGPHPAGDGVDRVVAAHVLDELQDPCAAVLVLSAERAAVHGAGQLVDRLVAPDQVHDGEQRRLAEAHVRVEPDRVDVGHQVAEDGALAAAGRHRAMGQAIAAMAGIGSPRPTSQSGTPVSASRREVTATAPTSQSTCTLAMRGDVVDQALVAQVAQRQVFRRAAQRHQRHQFALVEVERERMLAGHRRRHFLAAFVDAPRRWWSPAAPRREQRSAATAPRAAEHRTHPPM